MITPGRKMRVPAFVLLVCDKTGRTSFLLHECRTLKESMEHANRVVNVVGRHPLVLEWINGPLGMRTQDLPSGNYLVIEEL